MQRRTINLVGSGDACARSNNIIMKVDFDPETEFEAELISALEGTESATASASAR